MISVSGAIAQVGYMPHGQCFLWQKSLIWLHALADGGIALAYFAIPLLLLNFIERRSDIPGQKIFFLFSAFIVSCGVTHLLSIWSLWQPNYWFEGIIKVLTAIISGYTAIMLVDWIPQLVALPSAAQLTTANLALEKEVTQRERTEAVALKANQELQEALDYEARLKRITDQVRDSLDEIAILQIAVRELTFGINAIACMASINEPTETNVPTYQEYALNGFSLQPLLADEQVMTSWPEIGAEQPILEFCLLPIADQAQQVCIHVIAIQAGQDIFGYLWVATQVNEPFETMQVRLIQHVSNQCAIAIRQARLVQSIQQQVKELDTTNQLKDEFLDTVSHEMRTPMTSIQLAAEMLARSWQKMLIQTMPQDPELVRRIQRYLKILREECQHETELINNLLDLSRLESSQATLSLEELNLEPWLSGLVDAFRDRIDHQQQHLQLDIAPQLPAIQTEIATLERILNELLNNACKYTPAGGNITVAIAHQDQQLRLTVRNSDVTLAQEECERLFDKFYRIPRTDIWNLGGTGLGLALVHKLVTRLHGTITANCDTQGLAFQIQLPLHYS